MAWTYSGDPSSTEKDEYRFLIGDTITNEPILQDGEIQYILDNVTGKDLRLLKLFEASYLFFTRDTEVTLGPLKERPLDRTKYAKEQLDYYRKKVRASGISLPVYSSEKIFSKGMHSND